jgi:hypothetical protein
VLKPGRDEDKEGKVLYFSSSQSETETEEGKVLHARRKRHAGLPAKYKSGESGVKKPKLSRGRSESVKNSANSVQADDDDDDDENENEDSVVNEGKKTLNKMLYSHKCTLKECTTKLILSSTNVCQTKK